MVIPIIGIFIGFFIFPLIQLYLFPFVTKFNFIHEYEIGTTKEETGIVDKGQSFIRSFLVMPFIYYLIAFSFFPVLQHSVKVVNVLSILYFSGVSFICWIYCHKMISKGIGYMNGDLAKIGLMFFLHLFMLPLFVSANIFVDKNKSEVTQYPEDFKKYVSFIEAFFFFILFFLSNLLVIMHYDPRTAVLITSHLFGINVYLIGTLVIISGAISIVKTLTHMGVVRKSIKRGFYE
ncbi:hypothetical protein [Paenibacillus larvae]|uniref:hypothetical protein n=1 Tax=Paenibacillus larvae TaxID=1464 RepID=UPI001F378056|nr:hypothetical protein [Paenibacillus larvae]